MTQCDERGLCQPWRNLERGRGGDLGLQTRQVEVLSPLQTVQVREVILHRGLVRIHDVGSYRTPSSSY